MLPFKADSFSIMSCKISSSVCLVPSFPSLQKLSILFSTSSLNKTICRLNPLLIDCHKSGLNSNISTSRHLHCTTCLSTITNHTGNITDCILDGCPHFFKSPPANIRYLRLLPFLQQLHHIRRKGDQT
jgi:hypothetical protein